jgi:hypothetical protein
VCDKVVDAVVDAVVDVDVDTVPEVVEAFENGIGGVELSIVCGKVREYLPLGSKDAA